MAELKNHRTIWTNEEDQTLIQAVITAIENGESQRSAFEQVAEKIGRTPGAIEYHWKKIRKAQESIQEQFQGALAYALIDAVNDPQNPQEYPQEDELIKEITKGATKIHQMIKQIMNPNDPEVPMIPPAVAIEMSWILDHDDHLSLYDQKYLERGEYESILEYIQKPGNARNYFRACDLGYDIELSREQKIRTIYDTLSLIKPNEPGYMMARGMIVMMYHMIEIMDGDPEYLIKGPKPEEMPF